MSANHSKTKKKSSIGFVEGVRRSRPLYLLMLPSIIIFALFTYYPMYGIVIAFKNFTPADGIMGSSWAGLKYFKQYFNSYQFGLTIKNTIIISLYTIAVTFPLPVIMGLLVNQMKAQKFKKFFQVSTYLPHFISWVVCATLMFDLMSTDGGAINEFLMWIGVIKEPIGFFTEGKYFWGITLCTDIWKELGWNAIIFISAITSISQDMYEAADVDGATRMQKILHITLPALKPTIMILLILAIGGVLNTGYEQIFLMQNDLNSVQIKSYDQERAKAAAKAAWAAITYMKQNEAKTGVRLATADEYMNQFWFPDTELKRVETIWWRRRIPSNSDRSKTARAFWLYADMTGGTGSESFAISCPTLNAVNVRAQRSRWYLLSD